jgi:hypothetical protein
MERMSHTPAPDRRRFERILRSERLNDPSVFLEVGFFDEVPLYSRFRQVSFLDELGPEGRDQAIVEFALEYLGRVSESLKEKGQANALVSLTFREDEKEDPLVPCVFVCYGDVDRSLRGRLRLRPARSRLAGRIRKALRGLGRIGGFILLEENETDPGNPRVFLSERVRAGSGLRSIRDFREPSSPDPHRGVTARRAGG